MKELQSLRVKLMEKWNLFAKLGGEWNDGYFQAIRETISMIDDAIKSLERAEQKNKSIDYSAHIKNYEVDKINWSTLNKKTFWKNYEE